MKITVKKLFFLSTLVTGMLVSLAFNPIKDDVYTVDTQKSTIDWSAKKFGGGHTGTVKISEGSLIYSRKSLQKGIFIMNMSSITSDNERVTNHLKSPDFFSSEKNPTSKFEITRVSAAGKDQVNIVGNLTIKGITNSLSFPASIRQQNNILTAEANKIRIDRTKYDIRFRSKTFFGDIGDKAIDDEFELNIKLIAKKD